MKNPEKHEFETLRLKAGVVRAGVQVYFEQFYNEKTNTAASSKVVDVGRYIQEGKCRQYMQLCHGV